MQHEQRRWILAAALVGCLSALEPSVVAQSDGTAAAVHDAALRPGPLRAYVAKPDPTYEWRVRGRYAYQGTQLVELELLSQTWKGVLWKHRLVLIKPPRVADPARGVLIVGGGRWRDSYETGPAPDSLPQGGAIFVSIARRLESVVAVLGQVPFQPMFGKNEDELIAYTLDRYVATGDAEWPLLLPMVKSAVRAMDASSEAARGEWGTAPSQYTVLGGSKRGWTTWLTAAVDARVTALAPVVIDALNMSEQFPHQVESFGTASEKLRPYTDLHLDELLASDAGAALREIIDPYEYRAVITQPKLIVVATNDRFFPVDSANLYWNGLSGPKYLLYLPNNEHGINDYARLIPSLAALHASAGSGPALAALHWEYRWRADGVELCVSAAPSPRSVTVWRASSATRDFRDSSWTSAPSRAAGRGYSADTARPSDGYVAEFAEATFGDADQAYSLSTNVAIVAARADDDVAAKPLGEPGVCARR